MAIYLQSSLESILIVVLQSSDVENDRRLFLMDNDPSQTSKAVRKAMEKIEAEFHNIPARSLDLNSIENVFHLVKKSLYTISLPNRERN
jgi:transposase